MNTVFYDTVFTGGQVLLPTGDVTQADVAILDGKIAAIGGTGLLGPAREILDVRGLHVLPGVIDAHIHLGHGADISRPRVPSDATTESAAAAAGGVTTFLSYVIASEPFDGVFEEIVDVTSKGSRVDFGFHFVISTDEQLRNVPRYAESYGVPSFKVFMLNRAGEGARLGLPDIDDSFLFRLAEQVSEAKSVICPHCENLEVMTLFRKRALTQDPEGAGSLDTWNNSRPPFLEAEAVHRITTLARAADAAVHMVHCSSELGLQAALSQRSNGARISIETCIQYLTHSVDWPGGDKGKVNPPIRAQSDADRLWRAIANGDVDLVATDHVHRSVASKAGGIWKASPGFPGMELLLPVMLSEGHHKRGLSLARIGELLASNPARIMGCPTKGSIEVGKDADFAIVDLNDEWVAHDEHMQSDAGFSIYDGCTFKGAVVHTIVRGRFALRDRTLRDDAIGTGQYLRRSRKATGMEPKGENDAN